jgi:hypothetical protein
MRIHISFLSLFFLSACAAGSDRFYAPHDWWDSKFSASSAATGTIEKYAASSSPVAHVPCMSAVDSLIFTSKEDMQPHYAKLEGMITRVGSRSFHLSLKELILSVAKREGVKADAVAEQEGAKEKIDAATIEKEIREKIEQSHVHDFEVLTTAQFVKRYEAKEWKMSTDDWAAFFKAESFEAMTIQDLQNFAAVSQHQRSEFVVVHSEALKSLADLLNELAQHTEFGGTAKRLARYFQISYSILTESSSILNARLRLVKEELPQEALKKLLQDTTYKSSAGRAAFRKWMTLDVLDRMEDYLTQLSLPSQSMHEGAKDEYIAKITDLKTELKF